jgi:DNA-binding transcriptional ArsR family regulator
MTHGSPQRDLPLAAVEQADAAYVAAWDDLERLGGVPESLGRIVRRIITEGRRESGCLVMRIGSQRLLAEACGLSVGSVSMALKRLRESRLVIRADGALRLVLHRLVEAAEEALARAAPSYGQFDAAAALRLLGGERSAEFSRVQPSSAGARSVRKKLNTPVSVPSRTTDTGGAATERAERGRTGLNGAERPRRSLADQPAWRALQARHFRPQLDRAALRAAFQAAREAGLVADRYEDKLRFMATAIDLARDAAIRSPAAVLRCRVERRSCWRQSDAAVAAATEFLKPAELRRAGT